MGLFKWLGARARDLGALGKKVWDNRKVIGQKLADGLNVVSKIGHFATVPLGMINPVAGAVVGNLSNIAHNASQVLKGQMGAPVASGATLQNVRNIRQALRPV